MKFVGLSEETFLDHVRNKHGDKVARRRPEKLRRECRVCCDQFGTDAELGQHISNQHTNNKTLPFAGFGPKDDELSGDSDDDIFMEKSVKRKSGRRSPPTSPSVPPPPPARLVNTFSPPAPRTSRDWHAETDRFLNNMNISATSRRQTGSYHSSDDEAPGLSAPRHTQSKRPRLDKERCSLCDQATSDMPRHLARVHMSVCFSIPGNDQIAWMKLDEAVAYLSSTKGPGIRKKDIHELLSERHINPPVSIECIYCLYCTPPNMIVTDSTDSNDLGTKMFDHMERHEDMHKMDTRTINNNISWGCRLCEKSYTREEELERHMDKHKRTASIRRSITPRSAEKERRRGREDGEVSPSPRRTRPSSSGASASSERPRMPPPSSNNKDPRDQRQRRVSSSSSVMTEPVPGDKFQCQKCGAQYDELDHLKKHLIRQHNVPNDMASLKALSIFPTDLRKVACKYCSTTWNGDPSKAVLRQHRESHPSMHTSINDCYQRECRACSQMFTYSEITLWNNHVTSCHTSESPPRMATSGADQVQCSYCYEDFNLADLKRHVEKEHAKHSFQCGNCPSIFNTNAEAVRHMDFEHQVPARKAEALITRPSDIRGILCLSPGCKWVLYGTGGSDMEEAMEFHFVAKHDVNFEKGQVLDSRMCQYFCRICGKDKAFRNLKSLDDHVKEHIQQRKPSAFINSINKHLTSRASEDKRDRRDQDRDQTDRRVDRAEDGRGDRRRSDGGRRDDRRSSGDRGRDGDSIDRNSRDEYRGGARDGFRGGRDETRGGGRDDSRGGGDWKCSKCSFDNFASRTECKRCGEPGGNGGGRMDFRGRGGGRGDFRGRGGRGGGRDDFRGRGGRGRGSERGRGRGGRGGDRGGFRHDRGPRLEDWDCPGCRVSNFGNRTECFRCGLGKDQKPQEKGPSAVDDYRDQIAAMFAQHEQDLKQKQQESQNEDLEESFSFEAFEAVDNIIDDLVDEVFKIVAPLEEMEEEAVSLSEDTSPVDTSLHLELVGSELGQEAPEEEPNNGDSTMIEAPEQESLKETNNEEVEASEDSTSVQITEALETVSEENERDNSDDDYAPDSPGYTAPMEIEEGDAKPDLAVLQASEAAPQDGDDLDLQQETVDVTYECKLCTFQSKDEIYEVFMHLEENHSKSNEDELRSLVRIIKPTDEEIPDPIPKPINPEPIESSASQSKTDCNSVDITKSKDVTEEDVTMEDMTSGNTSEDTERSTSPPSVNTVEKLKEMLAMDGSVKFIVTPELQYTDEYKSFMEEYNKETEDEN